MKVEKRNCDNVKVGDVQANQWVMNVKNGRLLADPVGKGASRHTGAVTDDQVWLGSKDAGTRSDVWLRERSAGILVGERLVARAAFGGPCAVLYSLELRKL
jgi:hypothetical protein